MGGRGRKLSEPEKELGCLSERARSQNTQEVFCEGEKRKSSTEEIERRERDAFLRKCGKYMKKLRGETKRKRI